MPQSLNFPEVLLGIPAIKDALSTFYYLRASVQIEIRLNATPFHMGALMVSWLPNQSTSSFKYRNSLIQRSANHPMIISAANQNAVTLKIPWVNPLNYIILPKTVPYVMVGNSGGDIGILCIEAVCNLLATSPTVVDSVEVQVFASFDDIEVAGYVEAQSGMQRFSREAKSKTDNIAAQASTTSDVMSLLQKVPIIGDAVSSLVTFAGLFDKPLNVSSTQFVSQSFSRDLSMVDGVDNSQPLSLHPISNKASALNLMGHVGDDISIQEIIQTPMLRSVVLYTSANSATFSDFVRPFDQTRQDDWLKYVARMFSYWRGSIKYHIHFITNAFTSGRFKITILYGTDLPDEDSGNQVSAIVDVKGDTIFDLTVPFLYATMYQPVTAETVTPQYDASTRIQIQPISKIVSNSNETDASIYMMVWRSAGEDFMFSQLGGFYTGQWPPIIEEFEEMEAQTDIRATFKTVFPPIMQGACFTKEFGYVTSEQPTTVRELCKRYENITPPPATPYTAYPSVESDGALYLFSQIFKYWTGSRRLKIVSLQDAAPKFLDISMSRPETTLAPSASLGMAFTHRDFWPMLEVEIPYYCTTPFTYVDVTTGTVNDADNVPRTVNLNFTPNQFNDPQYLAAGDDFCYGFMVSPPYY